jgi:hypothetical protein
MWVFLLFLNKNSKANIVLLLRVCLLDIFEILKVFSCFIEFYDLVFSLYFKFMEFDLESERYQTKIKKVLGLV